MESKYEAPEIEVVETEYDLGSYYETAGGFLAVVYSVPIAVAVYAKNCAW